MSREEDRDNSVGEAFILFTQAFSEDSVDFSALRDAGLFLALLAQKDMKWEKILNSKDASLAISAFNAERDSLLDHVLEVITTDDPRYEQAVREAAPHPVLVLVLTVRQ